VFLPGLVQATAKIAPAREDIFSLKNQKMRLCGDVLFLRELLSRHGEPSVCGGRRIKKTRSSFSGEPDGPACSCKNNTNQWLWRKPLFLPTIDPRGNPDLIGSGSAL